MNNFKENKGLFFILLFGLGLFGFLTFLMLKDAFKADYVQIAGLILGGLFGFFAILNVVGLFYFFTKDNTDLKVKFWRSVQLINFAAKKKR